MIFVLQLRILNGTFVVFKLLQSQPFQLINKVEPGNLTAKSINFILYVRKAFSLEYLTNPDPNNEPLDGDGQNVKLSQFCETRQEKFRSKSLNYTEASNAEQCSLHPQMFFKFTLLTHVYY